MELKNKYVIGCLVMGYEVEMIDEYLQSCLNILEGIENPQNVNFHFCINYQEYLEKFEDITELHGLISRKFQKFQTNLYHHYLVSFENLILDWKVSEPITAVPANSSTFYNIAAYRRDLNYNWAEKVDFVLWGETDSLWPKQTLEIIELVNEMVKDQTPKFVLNFAGRKNWDKSWEPVTHPFFKDVPYIDTEDWILNNEASEKSYMTLERMNEINDIPVDEIEVLQFSQPKADGSCLVISTDLIKSGVNIPHALIHCGEDESFLRMAKIVMGDQFVQYHVNNILRVHNRRHPRKRSYIKGENNPKGFCDERKGDWWKLLENNSKFNLENLRNQVKFVKTQDVIDQIQKLKK